MTASTKPIKIESENGRNDFGALSFQSAYDDSVWSTVLAHNMSRYKLYHPELKDDYSVRVNVEVNFFEAEKSVARMDYKNISSDRVVGYATECMLYEQMLQYGPSGLNFGGIKTEKSDETVKKFQNTLGSMINDAKKLCGEPTIKAINDYIAVQFRQKNSQEEISI